MVGQVPVADLHKHLYAKAVEFFWEQNQRLDESSIRQFVGYVGKLIEQDGKPLVTDPKVILDEARSVFLAKLSLLNDDDAKKKELGGYFENRMNEEKHALKYSKQKISFAGLDQRIQVNLNKALTDKLRSIYANARDGEADSGREEKIVSNIVAAALNEASTLDSNGNIVQFSEKKYAESLNKLLDANINELSKSTVGSILEKQDEAGYQATAFPLIGEIAGLASVGAIDGADEGLVSKLEAGNYNAVSDNDKQAVNQFLLKLMKLSHEGRLNLEEEMQNLSLDKNQASYLQYLLKQYRKTNDAGADFAKRIAESIPGMIAPGLIGALIGWIFGGNTGLGAIGAVIINALGGLGSEANPVDGKERELPPVYIPGK